MAIRYPRGTGTIVDWEQPFEAIEIGAGELLRTGTKTALLSIGTIADNVGKALDLIKDPTPFSHYDLRFVKPLDTQLLHTIFYRTYEYHYH